MSRTVLTVDVGTTNWKVLLFTEAGEIVSKREIPARAERDDYGSIYDPKVMWESIAAAIGDILESNEGPEPEAVSITSMGEAGIPLGKDGEPVYPIITWYDSRTIPQARQIEELVGAEKLFEITGLDPNPVFSLAKLVWIKQHEPQVFRKISQWLSVADYINYCLCGEIVTDYSLASRTMAFDLDTGSWSEEILDAVGVSAAIFPPVKAAGTPIGKVSSEAARITHIPAGTPVVLGGHDHHCGYLAAGALLRDCVLDSSGTVESIMTLLKKDADRPRIFRKMRIGYFIEPTRYATMGGILASGRSVEWAIEHIWKSPVSDQKGYDRMMAEVAAVPPGAGGILYQPHLTGAGAPYWDPGSRGAFVGLKSSHTRAHLMRALFEGLSFELKVLLETVEAAFDMNVPVLNTVGGGARNAVWQQMKSDITGKQVNIPDIKDATPQGAALLAAVGIGIYRDLQEASKSTFRIKRTFEPREEYQEYYGKLYKIYRQVYGSLADIHNSINETTWEKHT